MVTRAGGSSGLVRTRERKCLGVYSLGANFALPAMVLVIALNQGFLPTYAMAGVADGPGANLRDTITLQVALVLLIGSVTALLGPPLALMAIPAAYAEAADLIPWITLGFVFLGLYGIPMSGISLVAGRTRAIWL